jgi:hypothetical protein
VQFTIARKGCELLSRKPTEVPHADLIDLLLDADEPTRKLILFRALQTGSLKRSEAERVIAQVSRLERHLSPRSDETRARARTRDKSAPPVAA